MNKAPLPPKLLLKFFSWFCHPDYREDIEGDLMERFEKKVKEIGIRKAKWGFFKDVLQLFRLWIINPLKNHRMTNIDLYLNHFKIASRHLIRHKAFSFISILGLAVGIAAFAIIVHYVSFELSYDQFHVNKDEIYRVICNPNKDDQAASARNYIALSFFLKDNFPEVKKSTRIWRMWNTNAGVPLKYENQIFYEIDLFKADKTFFEVFPSLLIQGDPKTVLQNKNSIVVSERIAKKYFGDEDPLGKLITDSEYSYTVTGISKDIPNNSHFNVDIILPLNMEGWINTDAYWEDFYAYTYVTFDKETDISSFESQLTKAVQQFKNEFPNLIGVTFELQPITDIHLHSDLTRELKSNSNSLVVYFLAAIGMLIMAVAWINHINLSISRFIARTKEIGIRKIIGSGKSQLVSQFLIEYFVITGIALVLAFLIVLALVPSFYAIIGISNFEFHSPAIWFAAAGLFAFGSFITGIYPSLLLSRINPANAFKGKHKNSKSGILLKKSLIVFQFITSIILIVGVSLLTQQLDLMRNTNKNVDIDRIVTVRNPTIYSDFEKEEAISENFQAFKNQLISHNSIGVITSSSAVPGSPVGFSYVNHIKKTHSNTYNPSRYKMIFVDYDFIEVYGIHLVAGRNYSSKIGQDGNQQSIILSESAIQDLGFQSAEDAVDQQIDFMLYDEWSEYEIIGVFKDYRQESLKAATYPTILFLNEFENTLMQQAYYSLKINSGSNIRHAVNHLETVWNEIWPEKPLEYFFLDRHYDGQYRSEIYLGQIITFFSTIAVFIACLGILGMTLFEVQLRAKEIGIRKVLGATMTSLISLFSKQYFQLVLFALIISIPIVLIGAKDWLSNYPTRIELDGWSFVPALIILFFIVVISSGSQIYRSANTNPVDSLRNE